MNDLLARMEPSLLIPLFGITIPIVAIIARYWYAVRKTEAEAALKRELVAAGFTPDEIERVVAATAGQKPVSRPSATAARVQD